MCLNKCHGLVEKRNETQMIFILQFQNPNKHKWTMKTFPLHPPIQPQGSIFLEGKEKKP